MEKKKKLDQEKGLAPRKKYYSDVGEYAQEVVAKSLKQEKSEASANESEEVEDDGLESIEAGFNVPLPVHSIPEPVD